MKSGAAQQYQLMTLEDIQKLPITDIAAEDSVLYLWVPVPLLPEGIETMKALGWKYKTTLVWIKTGRLGMGFWFRKNCELVLLGVRGSPKAFRTALPNIFEAPVGRHSEKPDKFYEIVEEASPWLERRVELFARKPRAGWTVWGDEV